MKDATSGAEIRAQKRQMRTICLWNRRELHNKAALSLRICEQLSRMHEYVNARTLATYVSLPEEVQTQGLIQRAWNDSKNVVIPCCVENEIRLFRLGSMGDLAPRTLGILEPLEHLRQQEDRWCEPDKIDLFVVPGVAFDSLGRRLGHGKGYYDRLLTKARDAAGKIALAFECQMVDLVPMTESDIPVDYVISEYGVHRGGEVYAAMGFSLLGRDC